MEANEICGSALFSNEVNIEKEGWGIFRKLFVTGCLKQFDRGLQRSNVSVFVKLSSKCRKTSCPVYHVDT